MQCFIRRVIYVIARFKFRRISSRIRNHCQKHVTLPVKEEEEEEEASAIRSTYGNIRVSPDSLDK